MPRKPRDPGVPKSPADYLGAELRAYREAAGLSRPDLAEKLGCTPQWVGQIELSTSAPSEAFAQDLDTFFATNGAFHRLWEWTKRTSRIQMLPPGFPDFLQREAEASIIYIFEAMIIPGLFQTRDYAHEVLRAGRRPDDVEQLVELRLSRQEILDDEDPPCVVAVLDEGSVLRTVGGPEVMRDQIRHLAELAGRPNITIQIVPISKGAYAGVMGAFMLLSFDDAADSAYIEGHTGGQLIDHIPTVRGHALRFESIRGTAMSADHSLALLNEILENQ